MSTKKDHLVKIRAKSDLAGTGVDEALARQMCNRKGKSYMAVVEVKVDELHDKASGQLGADLVITQFWPAADTLKGGADLDAHLRNLTRTMHQNHALNSEDEQLQIETPGDLEPKVSDVLAAGKALEPHEFVATKEGDVTICDVCGEDEDDARHSADVVGPDDEAGQDEPPHIHDPADPEHAGDKELTTTS